MRILILAAAAVLALACSRNDGEEMSVPADTSPPADAASADAPATSDEPAVAASDDVTIPAGETGGMCGGIAGFQCLNEADYCAMTEGECKTVADAAGTCQKKPEACTMEYDPVCGCDGKTYGNACSAAAEGVSIASRGECTAAE